MKTPYITVMITNITNMICWIALAIYFGKWWIALFSVLCFSSVKISQTDDEGEEKK